MGSSRPTSVLLMTRLGPLGAPLRPLIAPICNPGNLAPPTARSKPEAEIIKFRGQKQARSASKPVQKAWSAFRRSQIEDRGFQLPGILVADTQGCRLRAQTSSKPAPKARHGAPSQGPSPPTARPPPTSEAHRQRVKKDPPYPNESHEETVWGPVEDACIFDSTDSE